MTFLNIISLTGGLGLFLYGVSLMGDGLNQVAGSKMQLVLYQLSGSRLKGILLGIVVTALIQSSSAVSIMAIGFVNSGIMQLSQAIAIILGSIIGTSVTGWVVSLSSLGASGGVLNLFSTAFITGALATAGIILNKFAKKQTIKKIGSILLGFAVLMYGMNAMSEAVSPLRDSEAFLSFMTNFSSPVLGILIGMLFTAVIQSSAAAVGVLQALSMTGVITFEVAFPILLGIAVGGALPVLLSALGASANARRAAVAHLTADIFGALFCGITFYTVNSVHPLSLLHVALSPVTVALVNTVFRIVTVVVLMPQIDIIGKLATAVVKDDKDEQKATDWDLLDERFLSHPRIALEQSRIVVCSMAGYARENLSLALGLLDNYTDEVFSEVLDTEELVDRYEDKLGSYMVRFTGHEMTTEENDELYKYLHVITDFERISDHATNIGENAKEKSEKQIEFSEEAKKELAILQSAICEVLDTAISAFTENDLEMAKRVEPLEDLIDTLCDEMKSHHVARIQKGICTLKNGFVFNDLLTNFERISDHCSNIAIAMIELEHDSFDTHNYEESLLSAKDAEFNRYYREFEAKYHLS